MYYYFWSLLLFMLEERRLWGECHKNQKMSWFKLALLLNVSEHKQAQTTRPRLWHSVLAFLRINLIQMNTTSHIWFSCCCFVVFPFCSVLMSWLSSWEKACCSHAFRARDIVNLCFLLSFLVSDIQDHLAKKVPIFFIQCCVVRLMYQLQ